MRYVLAFAAAFLASAASGQTDPQAAPNRNVRATPVPIESGLDLTNLSLDSKGKLLAHHLGLVIEQVVDASNMIVRPKQGKGKAWLRGFPTAGKSQGQTISCDEIMRVTGTRITDSGPICVFELAESEKDRRERKERERHRAEVSNVPNGKYEMHKKEYGSKPISLPNNQPPEERAKRERERVRSKPISLPNNQSPEERAKWERERVRREQEWWRWWREIEKQAWWRLSMEAYARQQRDMEERARLEQTKKSKPK
jgi:hypothetical protein